MKIPCYFIDVQMTVDSACIWSQRWIIFPVRQDTFRCLSTHLAQRLWTGDNGTRGKENPKDKLLGPNVKIKVMVYSYLELLYSYIYIITDHYASSSLLND